MTNGRSSGGDFDPVSALVFGPSRQQKASGESFASSTQILKTRIKSPRAMFTSERENQGHPQSTSDLIIEVRSEGGGDQLTADMWFVHRGFTYWIKGKLGKDWKLGTTCYQVTTQNDLARSP